MHLQRSLWILLVSATVALSAETPAGTNTATRALSLRESIQIALEHNLNIQIERFNPSVAQFTLDGSYSYYDPTFKFLARQDFVSSPGGFNNQVLLTTPPNETWTESYNTSLGGYLPTGMRYDFYGNLYRTSGTFPFFDTNTLSFVKMDRGYQYRPDVSLTVSQPLLKNFWTDSSRTQIKINKSQFKFTQFGLVLQVMDIVTKVESAYFTLTFSRENVKVQEKALELAERLVAENRKKVQVGTMAPLDEKQAESQAAAARADLLSAHNLLNVAENALKNLITDDYSKWHAVDVEPSDRLSALPETFNLAMSWESGLRLRPDYNQLKESLEQQNILLKYRYNQLFPELDLLGTVGRNGLGPTLDNSLGAISDGDNPKWGGGAVLTFPLTFRGDRSNYRMQKQLQKQAVLKLKQLEQTIVVQIDDAVKLAQSNFERVTATRQAREFAEAALDAEQKKLESGKSTSFVVLQLQRDLTSARSSEISALAEYNRDLVQLYFYEGTTLQRNRIEVQVK